jgi:hypothetical protein
VSAFSTVGYTIVAADACWKVQEIEGVLVEDENMKRELAMLRELMEVSGRGEKGRKSWDLFRRKRTTM